ncbi:MAG: ABC transporter ATP-binding protein, partial [Oscillospiraceae bacterium]
MLKLNQIKKDYVTGDSTVQALKGIDIEFRENEFVSILGPSGCGKTTLLNIIGGLDRYSEGNLIINGKSTKDFKDKDWDTYRNHSIGFVFQSYNLIPHQTVLANVELALTLSGVSKAERRKRAVDVLNRVGLGDQLHKKPNQMSGGQMQRVAIARALINDPDILLADEPTGALDSETSVQIMELLKEISANKLIIMVTHNPELAEKYSSRIVRLLDGKIIDDNNPYTSTEEDNKIAEQKQKKDKKKGKKTSMSFFTALSLSCNNLLTKKARTFLTSFAGSIGIIGIALILSLSTGVQLYIDQVQEDTLSN